MRRKYSKYIMTLLIFTMFLTVLAPAAFGQETINIQIPVTVTLEGIPEGVDAGVSIVLEADSPDYPMPLGSENGIYRLIISEQGSYSLPNIEFSSIGIYTYRIYQEVDDEEVAAILDDKVYNLVVYVTNAPDGDRLESMVMLYILGEAEKQEGIVLDYEYTEEPEPEPEPPEQPEQPEEPQVKGEEYYQVPQTGDETIIWPYIGLFASGAALLLLAGFKRKNREIDDD